MTPPSLLRLEGLTLAAGPLTLAADVDLTLAPGGALGLVGESGCGKSITALAIMGLLPARAIRVVAGRIDFDGCNLLELPAARLRALRGNDIAMIFQEPMTSLNPVFTVGHQIDEVLRRHRRLGARAARAETVRLLDLVRMPAAAAKARAYPHELSGGQRQRVMIAMALACRPKLLIADEPTTSLDVTIQAQILSLIDELRNELGMGVILVSHDLGVIGAYCDRLAIMYAGRIVEDGPTAAVFAAPRHPYTAGLLACVPQIDGAVGRLPTIAGTVPEPARRGGACDFRDRCGRAIPACAERLPPLAETAGRRAACWNPQP